MRLSFEAWPFHIFPLLAALLAMQLETANALRPNPCAQIRQIYTDGISSGCSYQIPAKLAVECLKSMPFLPNLAIAFVQEYSKYLQFHSTVELLKDPPSEYLMPAVDLFGGLARISEKAAINQYQSQFEFDLEFRGLISSACDGHLYVRLCSLSIFTFRNAVPLVSISLDGLDLPQIYVYKDAYLASDKSGAVSPVVSINGVNAAEFLEQYVSNQPRQDPDAQYNVAFPSKPRGVTESGAGVWELLHWPGESALILKFGNGSMLEVDVFVETSHNLSDSMWDNGNSLFDAICMPPSKPPGPISPFDASVSPKLHTLDKATPLRPADGYPEAPVIRDKWNRISGYFLDRAGLRDVAVLAIPTFLSSTARGIVLPANETTVFARIARDFIRVAKTAGKSRILIDLSSNGGGDVVSGFRLFRNFFPDRNIYSATRFRSHDGINLIGKIFAQGKPDVPLEYSVVHNSGLDYHAAVIPGKDQYFGSWEDLYGPHEILGMNSSSLFARFNSSSSFTLEYSTDDDGVGENNDRSHSPPYSPEDIVIITDGSCASTCALFIQLMKPLGVRSIVFGGRPQVGPMQLVGGVKGGQYWSFQTIEQIAQVATRLAVNASLSERETKLLQTLLPLPLGSFPLTLTGGGVNYRNEFRPGDDQMPLQFAYEAADCRLFFTWENYANQESVWTAAANAMFGGGACVQDSERKADEGLNPPMPEAQSIIRDRPKKWNLWSWLLQWLTYITIP